MSYIDSLLSKQSIDIFEPEIDLEIHQDFLVPILPKQLIADVMLDEKTFLRVREDQEKNITEAFIEENGLRHGQYRSYYTTGNIKAEIFYLHGELHGLSLYFSPEGKILSKSFYLHGKQQGKSLYYYSSGNIQSIQRHKGGLYEGLQEFYFDNGNLKTSMLYNTGLLHGQVCLYYPNGNMKREVNLAYGKRKGMEREWNQQGTLLFEMEYDDFRPIGIARKWHPNGMLISENIHRDTPCQPSVSVIYGSAWNEEGSLIIEAKEYEPYKRITRYWDKDGTLVKERHTIFQDDMWHTTQEEIFSSPTDKSKTPA